MESQDDKPGPSEPDTVMTTEGSTAFLLAEPRPDTTALESRWHVTAADQRLVAETLTWFAGLFGTPRARFVRHLEQHGWVVQTLVQGKIVMQTADAAEIAIAWSVALNNGSVRMTRPRVVPFEGDSVRPIAVTNYVATPVICQRRFLGIFEAAGNIRSDADRYLNQAEGRLREFARELLFDPRLAHEPIISDDTSIDLACCVIDSPIRLSTEEWELVATLDGPTPIAEVARRCGSEPPEVVDAVRRLLSRGLVAVTD